MKMQKAINDVYEKSSKVWEEYNKANDLVNDMMKQRDQKMRAAEAKKEKIEQERRYKEAK